MFELFIALFGGIWLGSKLLKEKSDSRQVQMKYENERQKRNVFNAMYAYNGPTLGAMFYDGRITADEVYDVIGEDLREIYGDDYKRKIPLPDVPGYRAAYARKEKVPLSYREAYDPLEKAWHLYMSKKGKVEKQFGIETDWFFLGIRQMFYDEKPFEVIDDNIKLFKKIEENLHKNGADITLVGMPGPHRSVFMNGNVETRIAVYECLSEEDKLKSKRLW